MTSRAGGGRRTRTVRPYPIYALEEALGVAEAIQRANAGLPFERELLAGALGTTPKSSAFTMRLNASIAYGLTQRDENGDIKLTDLGASIVASENGAERSRLVAAAAMEPPIFGRFYRMLDGKRLPESANAQRLLQRELGVNADLAEECFGVLCDNGMYVGIMREVEGEVVVRLNGFAGDVAVAGTNAVVDDAAAPAVEQHKMVQDRDAAVAYEVDNRTATETENGVFVGRIGESAAANFVISVLDEFQIRSNSPRLGDADGSVPVPPEAAAGMRRSRAAILVLDGEYGNVERARSRLLCLLGAAWVLYDDRVVVFYEAGLDLGLDFEGVGMVRFERGRLSESGLGLLRELHRSGVVSITA